MLTTAVRRRPEVADKVKKVMDIVGLIVGWRPDTAPPPQSQAGPSLVKQNLKYGVLVGFGKKMGKKFYHPLFDGGE